MDRFNVCNIVYSSRVVCSEICFFGSYDNDTTDKCFFITRDLYYTDDLIGIQTQNLLSLPENYTMKYYYFHIITAPELSWVAVDEKSNIVGYVLAKA